MRPYRGALGLPNPCGLPSAANGGSAIAPPTFKGSWLSRGPECAERTYRPSGAASSRSPSPTFHGVAHVCPIAAKHGTALPYGIGRRGQLNVKFRAVETASAPRAIGRHTPSPLGVQREPKSARVRSLLTPP